jgi:hypothetical protein
MVFDAAGNFLTFVPQPLTFRLTIRRRLSKKTAGMIIA